MQSRWRIDYCLVIKGKLICRQPPERFLYHTIVGRQHKSTQLRGVLLRQPRKPSRRQATKQRQSKF